MQWHTGQVARIGFFIGFLCILSLLLIPKQTSGKLLNQTADVFETVALLHPVSNSFRSLALQLAPPPVAEASQATADSLIYKLNQERARAGTYSLVTPAELQTLADELLTILERTPYDDWHLSQTDIALDAAVKNSDYSFALLEQAAISGSSTTDEIILDFQESSTLVTELYSESYTHAAFATQDGITVLVLAEPLQPAPTPVRQTQPTIRVEVPQPTPTQFVVQDISDDEVYQALNAYRAVHGVSSLKQDGNLCKYAEMRVDDLIEHGSLDGHAGFAKDFDVESPEDLPKPIRDYGYGQIGENLASQYCRNMTTGDSFTAETGTALIEWCFDSSTAGHREAQLSNEFKDVCVRHGQNMYVIIFGRN